MAGMLNPETQTKIRSALRSRWKMLREAEELYATTRAAVDGLHSPTISPDGGIRSKGTTSDLTARQAAYLSRAENKLLAARAWVKLGDDVQGLISEEAQDVFDLLYTDCLSAAAAAKLLGVSRYVIYRLQEEIEVKAAMLAVERRLLKPWTGR
ncbi:MAG: hypothetical protein IJ175_07845 [Clostridia bacterium]|nr:hypothetical protein [Clostridia bacterium]